jgi:hypothetical protein
MRKWLLLMCLGVVNAAHAEGEIGVTEDEVPGGDVTIKSEQGGEVKEFRVNGRLYMIMVIPDKGVPYYLVDTDGDGDLETRRNKLDPDGLLVPTWVLKRW